MHYRTCTRLIAIAFYIFASLGLSISFSAHAQVKIMAVGDSITEGINGAESYRSQLVTGLNASGCNYQMVGSKLQNRTQTNFSSAHEGYTGHPVEYFLSPTQAGNPGIISMMNARDPDVLLVHLGSNDMFFGQTVSSTRVDLDDFVTDVWNINPNANILVANVIPWYGSAPNNSAISTDIAALGTTIENWVATENDSRLHLVDVRSAFNAQSLNSNGIHPFMQSDNIHPNAAGDAQIGNAFLSKISELNICPDTTPPQTFISSPSAPGLTLTGTHTFTGSATDVGGVGFDRVRIAIADNNYTSGNNRWFNFSTGTFGTYSESIASVANVTTTSLNWSFSATLPTGDYTVYALAVDNAGNQNYTPNVGVWPTNRQFFVQADSQNPTIAISTPTSDGAIIPPGSYNFSGTSSDSGGSGFRFVRFALNNKTLGQWYNFNTNSFSGAVGNGATSANLTNTSISATDWNYNVTLAAGEYTLAVRTFDNAGNTSPWTFRNFDVQVPDNIKPTTAITNPANNAVIAPGAFNFTGTAADNGGSGFDSVQFAVRSNNVNRWYNFATNAYSAVIVVPGATTMTATTNSSTNWNRAFSLAVGSYTLAVRSIDTAGNISAWSFRNFNVQVADNLKPTTSITNPANNGAVIAPGSFNFAGTAADTGGSGFNAVQFGVRNNNVSRWYNFSTNAFSAVNVVPGTANMTATTNSSTNWNRAFSLAAGSYTIAVRSIDNAGNISAWSFRNFTVQVADNLKPTTAITSPVVNGAVIAPGNFNFTGTAADTGGSGFNTVQFAVRNEGNNRWYNFSTNAFTGLNVIGPVAANLTATTNSSTNWNRSLSLSAGSYTLAVRAVDNAGNISTWAFRKFDVQVADNLKPTTAITSPAVNGAVIAPGNFNFTGTAADTGGSGFNTVQFAVRNEATNRWYNFSTNAFTGLNVIGPVAANLTATTSSSTNWNRSLSLSAGSYTLAVRAVDNAANISTWAFRKFDVQ